MNVSVTIGKVFINGGLANQTGVQSSFDAEINDIQIEMTDLTFGGSLQAITNEVNKAIQNQVAGSMKKETKTPKAFDFEKSPFKGQPPVHLSALLAALQEKGLQGIQGIPGLNGNVYKLNIQQLGQLFDELT